MMTLKIIDLQSDLQDIEMGLNLAQIDRAWSEWKQKVDIANQNLLAVSDLSAYQRSIGHGNPPQHLSGISQQQVSTALSAIERLFDYLELLNQQLDRVQKLRQELPALFISDRQLQEIEYLLMGASIDLPIGSQSLAQRDLFSDGRQAHRVSLADLLDRMTLAFAIARDTFTAIESAWTELETKLIASDREIVKLQELAAKLSVSSLSLVNIRERLTALQLQCDRDPLGTDREFDRDLAPLINNVRQELLELDRQRQQLQENLSAGQLRLTALIQVNNEAIAARSVSQSKLKHSFPMLDPIPETELAEMGRWLERLGAKLTEGAISPVGIGLNNWQQKMHAYAALAANALSANRLPLDTRQELRGRLDALKAKATAKGRGENSILVDLAMQARSTLFNEPTDLDLAIDLVGRYERELTRLLAC